MNLPYTVEDRKKWKEEKTGQYKINQFDSFKIDSTNMLANIKKRSLCGQCDKSRMYFCYTCYIPVPKLLGKIPNVKLPIKVDIIKHPGEIDGKSTASHAAILAPTDVTIHTYPNIPNYDSKDTVLVFPQSSSITVEDLMKGSPCNASVPFKTAVFIDATWSQTFVIKNSPNLKNLASVEMKSRETMFWRPQKGKPNTYLATIEAIYYFVKDIHVISNDGDYKSEYDNLLYFFKYLYEKIHTTICSLFSCPCLYCVNISRNDSGEVSINTIYLV